MAEQLTLSPDEQTSLQRIITRYPDLVAAVERQMELRIEEAVRRLQGFVMSESGVDYVLGRLVDRLVAESAPQRPDGTLTDDLYDAMTLLIARYAAGKARDGVVTRLLGCKRN